MGKHVIQGLYSRNPTQFAWMKESWMCPKCNQVMQAGGKGPHSQWCGDDKEARFWSYVNKNGPNGCWLWTRGKDKWGYGDLRWEGKHIQAHRLAWKLLRGDPGQLDCLHKCNNPACCNPEHLYLGTDLENARDRLAAGTYARGEECHTAKLTELQVREILRLRGRMPQRDVARKYGVDQSNVSQIWNRHIWTHIT